MDQIVTITKQGQVTIPKSMRVVFKIDGSVKASIHREGNKIIVQPKKNFWSLPNSLKSKIKLSDQQLKKARLEFSKQWPQNR